MSSLFSDVAENLRKSSIRQYRKIVGEFEIKHSFAWGDPPAEALPSEEIKDILKDIIVGLPPDSLHYGMTAGRKELRELSVEILEEKT